jgi:ADP-ribose pyrophosphatase YjhB (NUDIX family)
VIIMNTPERPVTLVGVIANDHTRVLLTQRRNNHHREPPGGVLELVETIEDGLRGLGPASGGVI